MSSSLAVFLAALVHLFVPPEIGNDREPSAAAVLFACKCYRKILANCSRKKQVYAVKHTLLARVTVGVCLQRAGSCETLVTDFALVLLLRA